MSFLLLLPIIPTLYYLLRRRVVDAILNVYLPVLLFIPGYYIVRIPHIPPLDASNCALIPIVLYLAVTQWRQWELSRADLWITLYALALSVGELGHTGFINGVFDLFDRVTHAIMPYTVGKLAIEQNDLRGRFIRRSLLLISIAILISVYEFRMGTDLFTAVLGPIFGSYSHPLNPEQIRRGFARIQGPYDHAIMAGTVFGIAWLWSLWLSHSEERSGVPEPTFLGVRRSRIFIAISMLGILMAQSRGPWLGIALGFAVSRIGNSRNIRRTTIIVLLLCTIGGGIAYKYLDSYTAGDLSSAKDQDQENAIYRRMLLDAYKPIVDEGGWFGWGEMNFPQVAGQGSIDNTYLYLRLVEGTVGLYAFVGLSLDVLLVLILKTRKITDKLDLYFAFTVLGVLLTVLVTMTTVTISNQAYQLYFISLGWALALGKGPRRIAHGRAETAAARAFQRVFA